MSKKLAFFSNLPFQLRLIAIFLLTSALSFAMSLFLNQNINRSLDNINSVYTSNNALNDINSTLESLQTSIQQYLETKSSDSLNNYYFYAQQYRNRIDSMNSMILDQESASMEKNIYNLSETYLTTADQSIEAKRARDSVNYHALFNEASEYYRFLTSYIYSLNNQQFVTNSRNYHSLESSLRSLERINHLMTIAVALFNIFLVILLVGQMTKPLLRLAAASDRVASGDFDVELPPVTSSDELGTVTSAFNQMLVSIRRYIEQVRSSMEAEKKAQERELLMETHLKDAQLKYYQAQIHPHFLFNSLNAGAQMAMMEDAERTCTFIQNMAEFFRYSMKSLQTDVYLPEEIALVENYLAIMNVRFSGDIHFEKIIDCDIVNVRMPCMILQPVVENAIQYGIRDIERDGWIRLHIRAKDGFVLISITDNGSGMTQERLEDVRSGHTGSEPSEKNSNGIGLGNVRERLKLYYNEDNLFSIDSPGPELGTSVLIRIPIDDMEVL
ncbi:MAG: histidine kinase [Eubacteriales bacterium]|nr:histidine kinase [Eubacteriales bacterium]